MPETVDPEELEAHPYSTRVFRQRTPSNRFITEFAGEQEEPLVITPDGFIVDGHRRWLAALEADLNEVEVRVEEYGSLARERRAILHQDDNRDPSFSQRMRLASEYEREAAPIVERRMQEGKPLDELDDPLQNFAEGGNVTTRELVADRVGWSGEKLRQARKVWEAAERGESWASEAVKDLDEGEESVNGAFKRKKKDEQKEKRRALREREDSDVFVEDAGHEELPDAESIFPYPGGKAKIADWIVSRMPKHTTYVEVFGGGAAVLQLKPPSQREVYNELDSDLVNFFEVLRHHPEELQTRLQPVDHTKEEYDRWIESFYGNGQMPDDPVKAAAVFFFARYAQWGAKHEGKSGYNEDKREQFFRKRVRLPEFASRFEEVEIENMEYQDVLDKYDSDSTLFYLDPPYVGTESRFQEGAKVDHDELAERVSELDGRWIVSYGEEYPDRLEEHRMEVKEVTRGMASGKPSLERLFMNYPEGEQEAFKGGWHGDAMRADW